MATSAATDSRGAFWAVTCTTGVWPRWPQVRPFGGLSPWPDSSSKTSQAPRSAAVVLSPARSPPARRRSAPRCARPRAGPAPARSSPAGAAAGPARAGCSPRQSARDDRGDAGQRPALVGPAPCGRAGVEERLQLLELGGAEPAAGPARALGGQRRAAAGGQRAAPSVGRHSGPPEVGRPLPVGGPFFDPLRGFQPHLLPPGALLGGQPTTLGVPHDYGIARAAAAVSRSLNPRQ